MRVLHVTDRASARGGADWHLLGVIAALAERGYRQLLAVGREDGSARPACPVERVAGLDHAVSSAGAPSRLEALARRWSPEVVHLHNAIAPEVMAWAADRGAVGTVQDHRSFCPGRGKLTADGACCTEPMSRALCRGCFEEPAYFERIDGVTRARLRASCRLSTITVLSRYMRGELVAAGVPADRVTVIPPFVHGLAADCPPSGPPCVLLAGRLVAAKGVHAAVAAWRAAGVGLPLVVAGTGPLRAELERAGDVELLGWLPHAELGGIYRRARALLMAPLWQEPFGIVGLEALSMGVPVAAWRSGGVTEWHPGGALLVEHGDVEALAAALRLAVGQSAQAPAGFDRAEITDRLEGVYRRAAS